VPYGLVTEESPMVNQRTHRIPLVRQGIRHPRADTSSLATRAVTVRAALPVPKGGAAKRRPLNGASRCYAPVGCGDNERMTSAG